MHIPKKYRLVDLDICIRPWNHQHSQDKRYIHHPEKFPHLYFAFVFAFVFFYCCCCFKNTSYDIYFPNKFLSTQYNISLYSNFLKKVSSLESLLHNLYCISVFIHTQICISSHVFIYIYVCVHTYVYKFSRAEITFILFIYTLQCLE